MNSSAKYCRLCLTEDKWNSAVPIFEGNIHCRDSLGEIIGNFADVTLSEDDGLPNVICHKCLGVLTLWIGFKEEIRKNDRFLRNMFCSIISKSRPDQNPSIVRMSSKVNVKSGNIGINNNFDTFGSDTSNSNQAKVSVIEKENILVPEIFQAAADGSKIKLKKKRSAPKPKTAKPSNLPANQDPKDLLISSKAPLFFCEICNRPFRRVREKNDHVKICHSIPNKEYFSCVYCTMTYMDKISVDCHKKLYHPYLSDEIFNQKEREIRFCLKNPAISQGGSAHTGQLNGPERTAPSMQPDFDLIEEMKSCDKSLLNNGKKRKQDKLKQTKTNQEGKKRCLDYGKSFGDNAENTIHETIVEVHAPMNSNDSFENNDNSNQENSIKSTDDKDNLMNDENSKADKFEELVDNNDSVNENPKEDSEKMDIEDPQDKDYEASKMQQNSESICNDNSDTNKEGTGDVNSIIEDSVVDETIDTNKEERADAPECSSDKNDDQTSNSEIKTTDEKRAYLCNVCSSTFQSMKELFYHKKVHK